MRAGAEGINLILSSMCLAERYRAGCNGREKAIIPDDATVFVSAKEVRRWHVRFLLGRWFTLFSNLAGVIGPGSRGEKAPGALFGAKMRLAEQRDLS